MQYDFDKVIDRKNTACEKWDGLKSRFGREDILPYWVADMEFPAPPPVIKALTDRARHGIFGYNARPDSYYQSIINWMESRHSWEIKKNWITFSPGVVPALSLFIRGYTNPGDRVIIQPPVYYPFFNVVRDNGCRLARNPLIIRDYEYRINFKQLEKLAADPRSKILLFCSPHNPVGRVWTREEIKKVGDICLKNRVVIVSDEIHQDIVYDGFRHSPLAAISEDFARNTITCTAPSKTFNLAGLKASNIIISNPELRQIYSQMLSTFHLGSINSFSIVALETAYNQGRQWLDQLIQYLEGNLQFLLEYIESELPGISAFPPEGTYLVWLDFRKLGLSRQELDNLIVEEAGIALDHGHWFGREGLGFERINIACPRSQLKKGLQQLKQAVEQL
ncbi:MAG: MalY/PatB family protein [Bacillota bacterium]